MGEIHSDPRPPRSKSFFLYLLDRGVSVTEYTRKMDEIFHGHSYYQNYPARKLAAYNNLWPDEWAAYVAICRISGTEPH